MADTEMVFPDKKIFVKPITVIQLVVAIMGGIVAAAATLWNVRVGSRIWVPAMCAVDFGCA